MTATLESFKSVGAHALTAIVNPLMGLLRGRRFDLRREEVRNARISFSQYGEDLAVLRWAQILDAPKIYVDAGCFDPCWFSNTLLLHKSNWRGVNIDLDDEKIQRFRQARPNDYNISAALSDKVSSVRALRYPEAGTNCIRDESEGETLSVAGREPVSSELIKSSTLDEILTGSPFNGMQIGYLNIDCEGHDLNVLKGCTLDKWKPYIITIEALHDEEEDGIGAHLQAHSYVLKEKIFHTLLFVRNDAVPRGFDEFAVPQWQVV